MKSWLSGQDVQANDTDGWDTPYPKHIKEFQRMVGNDVATKEIIEIDLVEGLSYSAPEKSKEIRIVKLENYVIFRVLESEI